MSTDGAPQAGGVPVHTGADPATQHPTAAPIETTMPADNHGDDAPADAGTTAATTAPAAATTATPSAGLTPATPMSKNQQKKLKRQQQWEDARDDRKRKRKEKRQVKLAVRRAQKAEGGEHAPETQRPKEHTLVPVSLIFDCDFEALMTESELISLSGQLTRSYAAARAAAHTTRIYVSSWGGKMRTRYETLLANQHTRWKNVHFLEADFQEAGRQASAAMRGAEGGEVVATLTQTTSAESAEETDSTEQPDVVYLTSDSPHTLSHLEPYTSYVIGGIVDKNREKGLCYRRATERGVRTAKLPIGEYMVMASRQVLTTNQVVEIMLAWLETGDWATAFSNVIPKRKGGHLRGEGGGKVEQGEQGEGEGEGAAEDESEQNEAPASRENDEEVKAAVDEQTSQAATATA